MLVVGIDEAGVGCLAGPLVVVAAAFDKHVKFPAAIKDSKKMTEATRCRVVDDICDLAEWVIIKQVSSQYINRCAHIWEAWDDAVTNLLEDCVSKNPGKIIVDGNRIIQDFRSPALRCFPREHILYEIRADSRFVQVSAASIVAKYVQTTFMADLHDRYPQFRFDLHKGYATKYHMRMLVEHGPVAGCHRVNCRPVRESLAAVGRIETRAIFISDSRNTANSSGINTEVLGRYP